MGKLVIACLLTVLLGGAAMFLSAKMVGPAIGTKGNSLNSSISTATVNQSTGIATTTAP